MPLFQRIEENIMAVILGLMTLITFSNVVARYLFNDNILWALEATVFLFAWLVLLGASYGVKHNLHIGVDFIVAKFPEHLKKAMALFAVAICLVFTLLLLKGSFDYWYPFVTQRAWLEVQDIPMPQAFSFIQDIFNEGEAYEKIPRFIPYFILPLSMSLLLYRFIEAFIQIAKNQRQHIIASHEAEIDKIEDTTTENHDRKN